MDTELEKALIEQARQDTFDTFRGIAFGLIGAVAFWAIIYYIYRCIRYG